jgi:hypothetical protein
MTDGQPRTRDQRRADTLAKLTAPAADVWVATAAVDIGVYGLDEVPAGLARQYAAQADWDPRESGDRMRFLVLRPQRIQAWREVDELPGRTLMRGGAWIA